MGERQRVEGPLQPIDLRDMWVVQRRERPGFALESIEAIRILRESGSEHLDGHVTLEFGIARAVDLAHPASTKRRDNAVRTELAARI